ncbi:hypothetical protein MHBO_004308, partial [Bonamia ostreae]
MLVKLYQQYSDRTAHHFMRSLRSDLVDLACKQLSQGTSDDGEANSSDDRKKEDEIDDLTGNKNSEEKSIDVESMVALVEKKRGLFLKDVFGLLEEIDVDPVLKSEKWLKRRFENRPDNIKNLEFCWILDKLMKCATENPKVLHPQNIPEVSKSTIPAQWWSKKHDILCLILAHEHGYNNWFNAFSNILKNDKNTN